MTCNNTPIEEYRDFIKYLADSKDMRIFLNSDEEHALEVLVQLFRQATQSIKIFANFDLGCMIRSLIFHL